MNTKLFTEAVVVGVLLAIIGLLTVKKINFISLFLLGAGFHLGCEFLGINKWYCRKGHACSFPR